MWGGCWGFYSSEVLPPFLVEQVLSLQSKSYPCRASLLLVEQVLSLQPKSFPCRASLLLVGQVLSLQPKSFPCRASLQESETWWASLGLRSVRGSTQRLGSTFFWPMDMGLLDSPSLISYFILFTYNVMERERFSNLCYIFGVFYCVFFKGRRKDGLWLELKLGGKVIYFFKGMYWTHTTKKCNYGDEF